MKLGFHCLRKLLQKLMGITTHWLVGGQGMSHSDFDTAYDYPIWIILNSNDKLSHREGLEDLTGGVTTELLISDILDDDDFWENELKKNLDLKDKAEILFSCTTGILDSAVGETRGGIREEHTYTIMAAKQLRSGEKLLLIR